MNLETLTQWLSQWAPWLLANSAGAGLLVLGVWLLRRYSALRNQPRWLYALGLLALLRLWMPGLPGIHWPWLQPAPVAAVVDTKPTPIPLPVPMEEPKFSQAVMELTTPPPPTPLPSLAVVEPVVVEQTISMTDVLSILWLTGALTVLGVASWQQARFSRRVARLAQPATEEQLELLAELQKLTGLRQRIALRVMPGLGAPAVFGWWRPRILLTETAAAELNLPELRHVLLHELSHIRRHDVLMNWVLILTRALHWFNPLVWLSQRWLVRDREILRDQQAMSYLATPEAPRDYGYTLLKLALPAGSPSTAPSLAPLFHSANELTRRILMISQTSGKRTSKMQIALAALAVSILTIATFTKAVAEETPATPKAPEVLGAIVSPQPTVEDTDESLAEPRAALKAFLDARNWQERAKYSQHAERLKPVMEAYYAKHHDGPISVDNIDYLTSQMTPDGKNRFHLFNVDCGEGEAFPVSLEAMDGGYAVDWESFVEFKDLALPTYFNNFSEAPGVFHAVMHRTHYFGRDVPNQDDKLCFIVEPPIAGYICYAWVPLANKALIAKLGQRAEFGSTSYPIVKLRWVKEGEVSFVMLDDIISDSWRSDAQKSATPAPATVTRLDELQKKRNEVKQELAELEASSKAGKDLRQEILALQKVAQALTKDYYEEKYLKPARKLTGNVAGLDKTRQEIEAEVKELTSQGLGESHPKVSILLEMKATIVELYYQAKYSVPERNPEPEKSSKAQTDSLETRIAKLMQTSTSPALRATVSAWNEAMTARASVAVRYGPKHPKYVEAEAKLATLRKELEEICRMEVDSAKAEQTEEKSTNTSSSEKMRITILGEVMRPGAYVTPPGKSLTILQAIGLAGGCARTSEPSKTTVQRTGISYPLHFDVTDSGLNGGGALMEDGDVIQVPKIDPRHPAQTQPAELKDLPIAIPVENKKGFVYSPYAPDKGVVDVSDIPPGTKVECPYTKKIFLVPDPAQRGRITIMGAVKKPGAFALPADPHVTVYEALEQAGGIHFPGENPRLDEYEAEVEKLRVQLTKLNKVEDSDQAIEIAAGLGLAGPTIKESLPKYHQAKIELTQLLDKGLGDKHPNVVAVRGQLANLKKDLVAAVEGLKRTLDTKIQIAETGLQSLKECEQKQGRRSPPIIRVKHLSGDTQEGKLEDIGPSQVKSGDIITVLEMPF